MYKTTMLAKGLLVVSLAAMLCGYMFAAEPSTQRDQDRTTQQTPQARQQREQAEQPGAVAPESGALHRTSKLIGKEVKNTQNENLGSLYDLVLTTDHQQISYAALSSGGTLGIGAKYYAIPWSAIQVGPQGDIVLPVSKSQLEQAPTFERNNWPAQATWQPTAMMPGQTPGQPSSMGTQRGTTDRTPGDTSASRPGESAQTETQRQGMTTTDRGRQPMGRMGAGMGAREMMTSRDVQYRRVTHLTGTPVRNAEGEDIGDIEDFVIDAPRGQVAYTIISFGGVWGLGEKYAAVPATAIQIQPRRNVARLDVDRATLEKIAFEPGKFPDLSNREYAQRLHETFNAEPYWTVMGFVSPEQEQAASQRAWGAEGRFARHFDPKSMKTVQGTVQSVGSFQPEGAAPGTPGGLRIRITTDEGNMVTVYGGPMWYAQQHDFYVKPGDKISVTGSETKIGWRPVLVASQIKVGDRTLQLRNEAGQPLWPGQQPGMPTQQPGMQQRPGTTQPRTGQQGTPQPGSSTGQRQPGQQSNE